MTEASDPSDPRVEGVREQHERVKTFWAIADRSQDRTEQFRLLMAAIYCARAVVELILDAAESQALSEFRDEDKRKSRSNCEQQLMPRLSHYLLIEKIRIHDFHRFGCLPPRPDGHTVFYGGPVRLTACKGGAALTIPPSGPELASTGNSSAEGRRPLCVDDGSFFDDASESYLSLREILRELLGTLPNAIDWFEQKMAG